MGDMGSQPLQENESELLYVIESHGVGRSLVYINRILYLHVLMMGYTLITPQISLYLGKNYPPPKKTSHSLEVVTKIYFPHGKKLLEPWLLVYIFFNTNYFYLILYLFTVFSKVSN